ncbi:hypothetical protein RB598_004574 [Gaeumannomyces tritici]
MATRRIVASEKTVLEKDDHIGASPAAGEKSDTTPAVPFDVIVKLLAFTFAMIVVPIGSYFATVNNVFSNSTYAGALAAIMANVVLIAYVVVAMNEDQSEQLEREAKKKS